MLACELVFVMVVIIAGWRLGSGACVAVIGVDDISADRAGAVDVARGAQGRVQPRLRLRRLHVWRYVVGTGDSAGAVRRRVRVVRRASISMQLQLLLAADTHLNLVGGLVDSGKRPPRPSAAVCPAPLWALIERCWTHTPDERPTMAEARTLPAWLNAWLVLVGCQC